MSSVAAHNQGRSQRLVLRSFRAEDSVQALADSLGWPRAAERPATREQPRRVVWEIVPGINLSYIEDEALHASYVVVTSSTSPGEIANFLRLTSDNLDGYSVEDLTTLGVDAVTPEDRARALALAGLGAPKVADDGILSLVANAARDPDARVREAVVIAASYAEWPELRPVLGDIAARDREKAVRKLAKKLLEVYDTLGIGEP